MREVPGERFRVQELPSSRVAVLFCADWCGYCHRFAPHFRRLPEGWVVDVSDEDLPLWDELELQVVPTVVVFEGGRELRRWAGVLAAHHVEQVREALTRP